MSPASPHPSEPVGPSIEAAADPGRPVAGIALCLSGGGYRAMVFHLGALWRLNEAGLLPELDRVSSVSGGSIAAAALGLRWADLGFGPGGVAARFADVVVDPVRRLAGRTVDVPAILGGLVSPFHTVGDRVAAAYDRSLFRGATLQDLPDRPRFVINATNVQSGALWRFMKPYMRDYRVGEVRAPGVPLAVAVAASSAFPPVLSPVRLRLDDAAYTPGSGRDLQRPPFTTDVRLTDGGVYDNLGLETAWKRYETILVSDGGAKIPDEARPAGDWARHARRVLGVVDNQVRSLRKRQLIDSYKAEVRKGAYWGIRTHVADYPLADPLDFPPDRTAALASVPTRLKRLPARLQEELINWGYAVCDAALRAHVRTALGRPDNLPFPRAGPA